MRVTAFFLLLLYIRAGATEYQHEYIRFKDGLPSETVFTAFKKDGFLYVATQRGLCRYDGYMFIDAPDVSHSVNYAYSDEEGIYFEEAGAGLCKKKDIFSARQLVQPVQFTDSDPDNDHFQHLYRDKRGYIWASDFRQVKYLREATGKWRFFPIADETGQDGLIVNYIPIGDDLLVATSAGLFYWQALTDQLSRISHEKIIGAKALGTSIFLSASDGRLLQFFPLSRRIRPIYKDDAGCYFVQHFPDAQLLMCYNNRELFAYNLATGKRQVLFIAEDNIYHVYYDRETSTFWISTENGLIRVRENNDRIKDLGMPYISTLPIKKLLQDNEGDVWCITASGNLWQRDHEERWKERKIAAQANDIYRNGNDLYISTERGLYRVRGKDQPEKVIPTDFPIRKSVIAPGKIWLLPLKGRPVVYDTVNFREIPGYLDPDSIFYATNQINDIAYAYGKLWLASWAPKDFGIASFDTTLRRFISVSRIQSNRKLFVGDYYNRIAIAGGQSLLFSAYGGWNKVAANGSILNYLYTREHRVANDNIQGIAEDSRGNIWFGCAEGLYQYNPHTGSTTRLSEIDGLGSNNITHAFYLNHNDQLLIAAGKSLQQIDLKKIMLTQLVNRIALSAIKVNDSLWPATPTSIRLEEKNAAQVTFSFSALNFADKEKVIYRYRFGTEAWNYLGTEPHLLLIKPAPGSYNITIQAGDNLGNWQKELLHIQLNIIPPFHKTKWFYGLLIVCAVMLGWLINRYLVKQEKQKGELKRKIKTNENHMLRSQMNPHFLFNSLNSINSFILQSKKEEASAYLTAFSKLMRRILDYSRREQISLQEELDTIKIYLGLETARMEYKFDYSIQVKDLKMDKEDIMIPPLILQPFLENAIWHGISHKREKGFIDIIITRSNENYNHLVVKIIDDGVGRAAAARFGQKNSAHKSQGLNITLERLRMSDARNDVEIVDLKDEAGAPCGTMILIKIMYHHD